MKAQHHQIIHRILPVRFPSPLSRTSLKTRSIITYGLQRSGQHLIIDWICRGLVNSLHLNNCSFIRKRLVYETNSWIQEIHSYIGGDKRDIIKLTSIDWYLNGLESNFNLIASFEDKNPSMTLCRRLEKKYASQSIVILRDPFNWLASAMKHNWHGPERLRYKICLLKEKLRIALDPKTDVNHHRMRLFIDYNKFITDASYREILASKLDLLSLDNAEIALTKVPKFGGGSSFSGFNSTKVDNSEFLKRWKHFTHNKLYRSLICDQELLQLSREFFGDEIDLPWK